MQNLQNTLVELLKDDSNYTSDGKLLKNKLTEDALKLESSLLKYLLKNDRLKKHFFIDVDGKLVFDKDKFIQFVNDKEFLPDSYTSFRNKIGLLDEDGKYFSEKRDVVLAWPYKDCVLEGGQDKEDQKRNEFFYNEVLAPDEIDRLFDPKVLTNFKRYDKDGEHKNPKELSRNDNLIIKGNNLLALHSLKKQYRGKVKLIYIDPPYNTQGDANTFLYNNSFNHSTWLSFMKSRLEISRHLMCKEGAIAIAIDDEEFSYLKVLCDNVFGRENCMGTLIIQNKPSGRTTDAYFATCHEYVMFYSKEPNLPTINFFELTEEQKSVYTEGQGDDLYKWRDYLRTGGYSTPNERPNSFYPIYFNPNSMEISLENQGAEFVKILPIDSNDEERVWRKTPNSFITHLEKDEIKIVQRNDKSYKVLLIDRIKDGIRPKSMWYDSKYDAATHGTKLLKKLFDGEKLFSFPKSLYAVKDIIELFTEKGGNNLVLDFFAGSGTTGHAVIELNKEDGGDRKYILCEQLDYVKTVTLPRLQKITKKVDCEGFVYTELKKWNQKYIDEIEDAKTKKQLLTIYKKMKDEAFFRYDVDLTKFEENDFSKLEIDQQKEVLIECLDKNHLYVNLSEMDDATYKISDEDKAMNKKFYGLD
tara:strand:+ start:104 stop:2026 length:1923 start_codon:yes stop_codon:yes gene_type:complete